jgi:hypothetical protein
MMMMIEVRKLATYINALGTGELLPRSGDFFESGAISPHHISCIKQTHYLGCTGFHNGVAKEGVGGKCSGGRDLGLTCEDMCPTPIFADVSQSPGSSPLLTCDPHRAGKVR